MHSLQLKPRMVRGYLREKDLATLETLIQSSNQREAWLASTLLSEALRAVKDNGYRLPMPFRFKIEEAEIEEITPPKRKAA